MSSNNTAPLSIDEAAQRVILVHLNKLKEEVNLLPNYVDLKHLCSELLFCIDQVRDNTPLVARASIHQVNNDLVHVFREFASKTEVTDYLLPCFDYALSATAELERIVTADLLATRPVEHFPMEAVI